MQAGLSLMSKQGYQSRRDVISFLGSAATLAFLPGDIAAQQTVAEEETPQIAYTVADEPWPNLRGNHRAHIYVEKAVDVARVSIPWRRLDPNPEEKAVLIFDPQDVQVQNVVIAGMSAVSGDILFEATAPGEYFAYYLPHKDVKGRHSALGPKGQYLPPQEAQSTEWMRRARGFLGTASQGVNARVVEFQARTALDSFYPMEVPATDEEVRKFCRQCSDQILIFTEDRDHPIKMYDQLPLRWIRRGAQASLSAAVLRGEFFVFQIGVYATPHSGVASEPVSLRFEDLAGPGSEIIPASAWTCVNAGGLDTEGHAFQKGIKIDAGKVIPLWCGVQIPLHCKHGVYKGTLALARTESSLPIHIELEIKEDFIRAGGVDQPERLSRIGWLNSTIGAEQTTTAPYTPLQITQRTASCLGRQVTFGEDGFPSSVMAGDRELLAEPVALRVYGGAKGVQWKSASHVTHADGSIVRMKSHSEAEGYELDVETTMEFDGGIGCEVTLLSRRGRSVSDIALEIAYLEKQVPYAVGMSLKGGARPDAWQWNWTDQPARWKEQGSNLEYFLWMGSVAAGLYCRLKSPLLDWQNNRRGGVTIAKSGDRVLFRAASGARNVTANDAMHFSFRLLPTPVKPVDPDHWKYRYVQAYEPPADMQALGATVINIHQGRLPNLFINYPFLNLDLLGPYVNQAHGLGMKVKLYYTMRELTTRLPELWTFRSLGDEIYRVGGTQGQGNPQLDFWLQEHLHSDYSPGWIQLLPTGEIDTSLRIKSDSRLANFYLEGLKWLLDNVAIDGLYLDEIGYPRATMQRVRRVLERRPGAMIDMHGNHVWWSCNCPIGYYMEHLPYIDRLWLGEAFDPDSPPDFWLIEMSGRPFGLSSDLLERPNLWRGMLFGMTSRAIWSGPSPTPIWKLWDAFGIEDSKMIGWWEEDAPVKTNRTDILATVYSKKDKCLIAVASWAKQTQSVQLEIGWEKLGIDASTARISAPALDGLQEFQKLSRPALTVEPGKGYVLLIEPVTAPSRSDSLTE
jgi:hypothetical protein